MQTSKRQNAAKALLLIGLGFFLYSRLANGTINFYINQRFIGFTLLAVVGLIGVGLSYRLRRAPASESTGEGEQAQDEHKHNHALSWGGACLVLLPIVLGLLVPPQPLGAAALSTRGINSGANTGDTPAFMRNLSEKTPDAKNILDWWQSLRASAAPNQEFVGQPANVTGFVYQDQPFGATYFMVTRFVVSCCAADASPLGLVVQWPAAQTFKNDQWVEVKGTFAPTSLADWQLPVLVAESVTPVDVPNQPYLYP